MPLPQHLYVDTLINVKLTIAELTIPTKQWYLVKYLVYLTHTHAHATHTHTSRAAYPVKYSVTP